MKGDGGWISKPDSKAIKRRGRPLGRLRQSRTTSRVARRRVLSMGRARHDTTRPSRLPWALDLSLGPRNRFPPRVREFICLHHSATRRSESEDRSSAPAAGRIIAEEICELPRKTRKAREKALCSWLYVQAKFRGPRVLPEVQAGDMGSRRPNQGQ